MHAYVTMALAFRITLHRVPNGHLLILSSGAKDLRLTVSRVHQPRQLQMMTESSAQSQSQRTPGEGSHQAEMEVKKSRFIGYATHVESWGEAQAYLQSIKGQHPKARHWCYGFRCGGGDPSSIEERSGDDGEPTGTAGLPILSAIKGEGLSDTMCVVVRYFGGIKLGSGGLIRAYGAAARLVLRESPVDVLIPKSTIRARVSTEHVGSLYEAAARLGATVCGEVYGPDGALTAMLTCETSLVQLLRDSVTDLTRGSAVFED
jgi:uncharacterized YigZ family protein